MSKKKKNDELMHHGIKGMKWGVRRYQNKDGSFTPAGIRRAEKDAKKIANAKARENDATAEFEKRLRNSTDNLYINDSFMKVLDAQYKRRKIVDKVTKKYSNTQLSDITIKEKVNNGRKYTAVLLGRVGNSPYDGTQRYLATAGSWTKSDIWGEDRFID